MVESLLRLAGLDWRVPDFSTVCRRQWRKVRASVSGDGAYDTKACHAAIVQRGAQAGTPPRKNG
jgi:hypothetical protein